MEYLLLNSGMRSSRNQKMKFISNDLYRKVNVLNNNKRIDINITHNIISTIRSITISPEDKEKLEELKEELNEFEGIGYYKNYVRFMINPTPESLIVLFDSMIKLDEIRYSKMCKILYYSNWVVANIVKNSNTPDDLRFIINGLKKGKFGSLTEWEKKDNEFFYLKDQYPEKLRLYSRTYRDNLSIDEFFSFYKNYYLKNKNTSIDVVKSNVENDLMINFLLSCDRFKKDKFNMKNNSLIESEIMKDFMKDFIELLFDEKKSDEESINKNKLYSITGIIPLCDCGTLLDILYNRNDYFARFDIKYVSKVKRIFFTQEYYDVVFSRLLENLIFIKKESSFIKLLFMLACSSEIVIENETIDQISKLKDIRYEDLENRVCLRILSLLSPRLDNEFIASGVKDVINYGVNNEQVFSVLIDFILAYKLKNQWIEMFMAGVYEQLPRKEYKDIDLVAKYEDYFKYLAESFQLSIGSNELIDELDINEIFLSQRTS